MAAPQRKAEGARVPGVPRAARRGRGACTAGQTPGPRHRLGHSRAKPRVSTPRVERWVVLVDGAETQQLNLRDHDPDAHVPQVHANLTYATQMCDSYVAIRMEIQIFCVGWRYKGEKGMRTRLLLAATVCVFMLSGGDSVADIAGISKVASIGVAAVRAQEEPDPPTDHELQNRPPTVQRPTAQDRAPTAAEIAKAIAQEIIRHGMGILSGLERAQDIAPPDFPCPGEESATIGC